jgi:hypothetical protein
MEMAIGIMFGILAMVPTMLIIMNGRREVHHTHEHIVRLEGPTDAPRLIEDRKLLKG